MIKWVKYVSGQILSVLNCLHVESDILAIFQYCLDVILEGNRLYLVDKNMDGSIFMIVLGAVTLLV